MSPLKMMQFNKIVNSNKSTKENVNFSKSGSENKNENKLNSIAWSGFKTNYASNITNENFNSLLSNENNSVSSFTEIENIIVKNIDFCDDVLKLIVVGDKMVGKSTLISQIKQLDKVREERNINNQYFPTQK